MFGDNIRLHFILWCLMCSLIALKMSLDLESVDNFTLKKKKKKKLFHSPNVLGARFVTGQHRKATVKYPKVFLQHLFSIDFCICKTCAR